MSDSATEAGVVGTVPTRPASRLRTVILVFAAFALYFLWTRPAAPLEGWAEDFEAAMGEAQASGRPLLMAFHLEGCGPCLLMERQVLPDERVRSAVRGFVPVRVDAMRRVDLARRYGVAATPAFVIADASGQLVSQILGFRTVEGFLEFLQEGAKTLAGAGAALP